MSVHSIPPICIYGFTVVLIQSRTHYSYTIVLFQLNYYNFTFKLFQDLVLQPGCALDLLLPNKLEGETRELCTPYYWLREDRTGLFMCVRVSCLQRIIYADRSSLLHVCALTISMVPVVVCMYS